jgi:hypothetical protein
LLVEGSTVQSGRKLYGYIKVVHRKERDGGVEVGSWASRGRCGFGDVEFTCERQIAGRKVTEGGREGRGGERARGEGEGGREGGREREREGWGETGENVGAIACMSLDL